MTHGAAPPARQRSARWAPLVAAAAAVTAVGLVAAVLGGGEGDERAAAPPPLRLSTAMSSATAESADTTMLAGSYRLEGALPADGPERGRVHRLTGGQVDEDAVLRLASAFGMTATPRHADGRWTVASADGGASLEVADDPGNPWWYGQVQQVDPAQSETPLPVEPVPGTETGGSAVAPVEEADPVAEAAALDAALPVLAAVDLAETDVRTEAYGAVRAVVAAHPVDGLPTQGMDTRLEVGPQGDVLWANGMLGGTTAGEEYPLVSAQQAFDLLAGAPHPGIAALCAPDLPCGPVEQVVTGAQPGLQLNADDQGPLLVPAWLFSVRGTAEPAGHVAVDPAHLWTPDQPEPPVAPPVTDDDAPVERTTFGFDRVARGVADDELVVGYGDSSSCPHRDVTPLVQETDDEVRVRLEADAYPPDTACTSDYVGIDLTLPLERPLGDRVVVDETSGTQHTLPPS